MTRRVQILAASVLLMTAAVFGLVAWHRVSDMREFTRPHRLQTSDGANYVIRLAETTVGRTDNGYAIIFYMRLENPSPTALALKRNQFVLIDQAEGTFRPSTTGTQTDLIRLPANGVIEREMLSFTVQEKSLAGALALQLAPDYRVEVKSRRPFVGQLAVGEFRSYQRRGW